MRLHIISDRRRIVAAALSAVLILPGLAWAQGLPADYARAEGLADKWRGLVTGVAETASWSKTSDRLWYRRSTRGGNEFISVDPKSGVLTPAFDHEKIAQALTTAAKPRAPYAALTLPFSTFTYEDRDRAIDFSIPSGRFRCALAEPSCERTGDPVPVPAPRGSGMGPRVAPGTATPTAAAPVLRVLSPNRKLEAFVREHNIWLREVADDKSERPLSKDGSAANAYALHTGAWSPNSKMLAVVRTKPGDRRVVTYIESSPADQLQPKLTEMYYLKPGDALPERQPVLFDVESGEAKVIDRALFPNAYAQTNPAWWKDSRGFRINYNQRGHQLFRVLDIDAETGKPRTVIEEKAATYFNYSGKQYLSIAPDEEEAVWMSERDGWNHLYLYDIAKGEVKNQITRGEFAVKAVTRVDHRRRQIWFTATGKIPEQDPYFIHYYRVDFDGSNLAPLTTADGSHTVAFSPDNRFYIDTWSRVDLAPVTELRRTADQSLVAELGRGDLTALKAAGWIAPEPFVAKGRDGKTDIHGVIIRPTNFDPAKSYPVIENIYAGPQDSFTPKTFTAWRPMHTQAELGFIVVQVDGMGTSNRSKAFQDVSWKNLGDGGFPDRILWHKAIAAKHSWYDISRVGVYGGSAGGQNALGALLFHPEFYDAAFAFAGSHDNRMDKIWWNEQFMGWPVGPEYAKASNVDNAHRLQGKLMLVVGELDNNVDPASTYQVANALIKAGKTFDFLFLPGTGHSEGGRYGERRRWDFFVQNLMGVTPPNRNAPPPAVTTASRSTGETAP